MTWLSAWKLFTQFCRRYVKPEALLVGFLAFTLTCSALANPVLGHISSGNVSIQQSSNSTVINQASQKAIINWQSFNIGQQESTHFQQPTGGITLNRINPTQGLLKSMGS